MFRCLCPLATCRAALLQGRINRTLLLKPLSVGGKNRRRPSFFAPGSRLFLPSRLKLGWSVAVGGRPDFRNVALRETEGKRRRGQKERWLDSPQKGIVNRDSSGIEPSILVARSPKTGIENLDSSGIVSPLDERRERINSRPSISGFIVVAVGDATFDFIEKKDGGRVKVGRTFNEVRCPQKESGMDGGRKEGSFCWRGVRRFAEGCGASERGPLYNSDGIV